MIHLLETKVMGICMPAHAPLFALLVVFGQCKRYFSAAFLCMYFDFVLISCAAACHEAPSLSTTSSSLLSLLLPPPASLLSLSQF